MTLVARTRFLDTDVDLLAAAGEEGIVFMRGRVGFAAVGTALRVPLDAVGDALGAIEVDDEVDRPGSGPVAFGALPFAGAAAGGRAELMVPHVVYSRADDGARWVTTVGDPVDPPAPLVGVPPSRFQVAPSLPPEDWCDAVAAATKEIRDRRLTKVVLAREVVVEADGPFCRSAVIGRLAAAYPGCFVYGIDGLVGASPELLVARQGAIVRAHPMAGTAPRSGDPTTDARLAAGLLADHKIREEHQITIDMVHDTLLPRCSYLDYEAEPSVVAMANVSHLATMVEGQLSSPLPSVLELVAALHPTPAVCGWPRAAALEVIAELERLDRGRYAGAVGWVDGRGNGAWAVAIRCAELEGAVARLYAGNGIVADSDPAEELAETQAKLQALLHALIRP